jgi:hypothetical protein
MKLLKACVIAVLACICMCNAGVLATNSAADVIQEEVKVTSVSDESRQTSLFLYILYLYLISGSIVHFY